MNVAFVCLRRGWAKALAAGLGLGWLCAHGASAQEKDLVGAKDHPLVSRYTGSVIIGYAVKEYDAVPLVLGPWTYEKQTVTKSKSVEGKVTRIVYLGPKGRSTLEIYRNYEVSLKRAGFQVLWSCSEDGCGANVYQFLYSRERQVEGAPEYAFGFPKNQRYLCAQLSRREGDVYVSLYVAVNDFDIPAWLYQRVTVLLEIVEAKPLEAQLVKVDASAMAKAIASAGRVAIYGIYFDSGKADLKPESQPTLAEIAKLLKQDPRLTLYVVGHTDGVGGFEYNMDLSRRRAEAVVQALFSGYGVDPKRLKPFGLGPLAPVASNETEEGRAKNRRVELVKQ
jgi:outer membrane protein OmpA-like peptidoglycan-associated protein